MEIINSHCHIYPDKIAQKASYAIGNFYDIPMKTADATTTQLLENGKKAGVSGYIVHSVATTAHQVHIINTFIKREMDNHKEFYGFMTLHQDLTEEEMEQEVAYAVENGFYGLKLHPDFQKFNIDDESVFKIYRVISQVKKTFPILFHTGDNRYDYSKPFRLANVAKEFKNLTFIGAHFGGYRCWDELDVYTGLENVYFDTSSSLAFISPEKASGLIKKFGADRYFFGDDFPMWNTLDELERFNKLTLTDREKEKILSKNIKALLNIK